MHSTLAPHAAAPRSDGFPALGSTPSRARRLAAFAIDLTFGAVLTGFAIFLPPDPGTTPGGLSAYSFLPYVPAAYLLFRDSIGGRSLGKLLTGLVVWDEGSGRPAGFMDSVIRNAAIAVLLVPLGGPLVQGALWPLYLVKLAASMLCVVMLVQVLHGRPRRILEGPATTRVIDARRR